MNNILKSRVRIFGLVILLLVLGYFGYHRFSASNQAPQYQITTVQKGTLVTSISASGQITSGNNVSVTTQSSGVVKDVYVKNGDTVSQGQTIADLTLDQASQQKQASAYASYLSSKNSLDNANAKYHSLQNTLFVANQKFINDAVARTLATSDPTYIEENATWLQAEADYKNQATAISAAQSSLAAASLNLSQLSSTITAPISGTVTGLTITPGSQIVSSQNSSGTTTAQSIGSVALSGPIQAQVNLSEIDSVNVNPGQKVTMTLDAFSGKTFTGKVVSINTNGVVSSGVTTYPAVITFDTNNTYIYPNMGVSAKIITGVYNDVLLVPSTAIQSQGGQSAVRVLQNSQVQTVAVEIGNASDTQTEIKSGLSEGETVVTGTITTGQSSGQTGTSIFGGSRGGFGGGGGGAIRVGGGRGG